MPDSRSVTAARDVLKIARRLKAITLVSDLATDQLASKFEMDVNVHVIILWNSLANE